MDTRYKAQLTKISIEIVIMYEMIKNNIKFMKKYKYLIFWSLFDQYVVWLYYISVLEDNIKWKLGRLLIIYLGIISTKNIYWEYFICLSFMVFFEKSISNITSKYI